MIAVLGTLPFLATLWLLVVLGAAILEDSGAKIAAALKGKISVEPKAPVLRSRTGTAPMRVTRVTQPLRAAA